MSTETNQVHCATPGCGGVLPVAPPDTLTMRVVAFPDEPLALSQLLTHGVENVCCAQCKRATRLDAGAVCFAEPMRCLYVYLPPAFEAGAPEVIARLLAERGASVDTYRIHFTTDPEQFRRGLLHELLSFVGPHITGFFRARKEGNLKAWQEEVDGKIDRAFFAGAWLVAGGSLPVMFWQGEDVNLQGAEELRRQLLAQGPAHVVIRGIEQQLGQQDIQSFLQQGITQIALLTTVLLARQLASRSAVDELEAAVAQRFHPCVITRELVEQISKVIAATTQPYERYVLLAILAAMCRLAGLPAAMPEDWAEVYIMFELARETRSQPEEGHGRYVTPEFAFKTIAAWRIGAALAQIQLQMAAEGNEQQAKTWLTGFLQRTRVAEWGMSYVDQAAVLMSRIPGKPSLEENEAVIRMALDHPKKSLPQLHLQIDLLAVRDVHAMIRFGEDVRGRLFGMGAFDEGTHVACWVSRHLQDKLLYRPAANLVDACLMDLRASAALERLDKRSQAMLWTEKGNALRYLGELEDALEAYNRCREFLPEDLADSDVRVNVKNIAIILRDKGRVWEALKRFHAILPYEEGTERALLLHSIAMAQRILCDHAGAEATIRQALTALPENGGESDRCILLVDLAIAALWSGGWQTALDTARELEALVPRASAPYLEALAAAITSRALEELGRPDADLTERAIELLREQAELPAERQLRPAWAIIIWGMLAERLAAGGHFGQAERKWRAACRNWARAQNLWDVWTILAMHAVRQGKHGTARRYLMEAAPYVICLANLLGRHGDPFLLMSDKNLLQRLLADEFLRAFQAGEADAASVRLAADLQASVLLSDQLHSRAKQDRGWDHVAGVYADANLQALLSARVPALAVLQVAAGSGGLAFLLTTITTESVSTRVLPCCFSSDQTADLVETVLFQLKRQKPLSNRDPFAAIPEWQEVTAAIRAAVREHVEPGTHLCFVPGPLTGFPLHVVLGQDFPFTIVPSLASVCEWHRLRLQKGASWRPCEVVDFVVWRVREKAGVEEEFHRQALFLHDELSHAGVAYKRIAGFAGTGAALLCALSESECVRISCHGLTEQATRQFALLVADGEQLPPEHPEALATRSRRFLVGWEQLGELKRCAPLVFAAACGSGMVSSVSGERVGLERPLFRAGALAYVAPQWPVPVSQIQALVNRIILRYMQDRDQTLAQVVQAVCEEAEREGTPAWAARSVAVHGVWL